MANLKTVAQGSEPLHSNHAHLLCWKSIFSGVLISVMSYMLLAALGAGVVGSAAQNIIEHERNGSALATGSGLWLGIAAVISLFLGSYFAVRIAKSVTNKVGAAHGFVIASIFFILMMMEASSGAGALSRGFGQLVKSAGQGTAALSTNPTVQDAINRNLASANLKSDPRTVVEGLGLRLMQGDVGSAKSYYAYQTGVSGAELDAQIAQLQADFDRAVKDAGEKVARAVADTGWSLFVIFLVGLVAALMGGRVAAHANTERPLSREEDILPDRSMPVLANQRGSALPYIFGWLLGVPTSILFLIFLLRTVF